MSVVVFAPVRSLHTATLISALRAGLGPVRNATDGESVLAACEQGARAVVLDLRHANGQARAEILAEIRRACPVPMAALVDAGRPAPAGCDAVFAPPVFLEDVVRWCARSAAAPLAEGLLRDLAAGLCHEIGNPLTSLFLQLELLKADDNSGIVAEHLTRIEESARRIESVVKDVAHAAERHPVRAEATELAVVLKRTAERLGGRSPELAARVDVTCGELPCRADANLLADALADLWEYLLLAGGDDDRLVVSARRSGAGYLIRHKALVPRLPDDAAGRLFTPLWARQALGLAPGLSLTSARNVFRRHQGDLRAHAGPEPILWVEALLPDASQATFEFAR